MMRIGILGGGQLGLMLAQAGAPLGHRFRFLDPSPDACARQAGELIVGSFDDHAALDRFAEGLDVATYEFENVPCAAVEHLSRRLPVLPSARSLRTAQDRLLEKSIFADSGFETAPFRPVDSEGDLTRAMADVGAPGVLKARRGGYDGRAQVVVQEPGEATGAWRAIAGVPAIYEAFVPFQRELSLVAARTPEGHTVFYPLVENHHDGGILRVTLAPAHDATARLERDAREHATALMERLDHVGVLTVEFFHVDGRLLANEFAPRVHNSGHWSIEGAAASQFETHVRAITGAPLPDPTPVRPSVMVNLIGDAPPEAPMRDIPHVHVHLYNKKPRPGRKIGHCTITGAGPDEMRAARARLEALIAHWTDEPPPSP